MHYINRKKEKFLHLSKLDPKKFWRQILTRKTKENNTPTNPKEFARVPKCNVPTARVPLNSPSWEISNLYYQSIINQET
jgi:hypothetical protein